MTSTLQEERTCQDDKNEIPMFWKNISKVFSGLVTLP